MLGHILLMPSVSLRPRALVLIPLSLAIFMLNHSVGSGASGFQQYINLIQRAFSSSLDRDKPYAVFDFPNHSNVGDSAIWQGQAKALLEYFGCNPILTCQLLPANASLPRLNQSTQVIINGGGNLGDLWPWFQIFRERLIQSYPCNRIVQMPQSIYFQDTIKMHQSKYIFSAHQDFTLMVRDHQSYKTGMFLNGENTLLVPDMALALGAIPRRITPVFPIVCILRQDHESTVASHPMPTDELEITDWTTEPHYSESKALLWIDRLERKLPAFRSQSAPLSRFLHNRLSASRLKRGCDLLSLGHVVITDRLHAHILCTLMGIPHVILDNRYGKISNFRNAWKTGGPRICVEASDMSDAIGKARKLLRALDRPYVFS